VETSRLQTLACFDYFIANLFNCDICFNIISTLRGKAGQ
jgi:hypothetical protein